MKASPLPLVIPVFIFFILAATLDLSPLLRFYSDYDLTPYLAARSLADDFDLAYTRQDSDRYFKEQLQRPSRFFLKRKKIFSSSGNFREYYVFFAPDVYTFALVPFVKIFHFKGIFFFNAILMGLIYLIGYSRNTDALSPLLYYTLLPLPIMFFIPSHHLFLFAAVSAAVLFGLQGRYALCAIALSIAVSSQIWCAILAVLFVTYLRNSEGDAAKGAARFAFFLTVALLLVWAIKHQMYPNKIVSETRWINEIPDKPLAESWTEQTVIRTNYFGAPELQTVVDLVFGRTVGSFVYGFIAFAMMLSAVWLLKDQQIRFHLLFLLLLLLVVSFTSPLSWNVRVFASDFSILIWSIPFFLFPLARSRYLLVAILIPSIFMIGPLLVNPVGAITDRYYYLQAFPYRYFPVELSLVGKAGRTAKPDYRLQFPGGWFFFLNDNFYHDQNFFWVRGESSLEFLIRLDLAAKTSIKIQSGDVDDHVLIHFDKGTEEFFLGPQEFAYLNLAKFRASEIPYAGYRYLHGKIESKNGYAPKLLSRENPDYRYLGCQIHLINDER